MFSFKSENETFDGNISFEKICEIYECDKRFKNIVLFALDEIEQTIKTKIAYYLAHKIGPVGYLDEIHFKDKDEYKNFIDNFNKAIKANAKLPFVKHHIKKYGGVFPIWVAIELFTLGNLKHFYLNLNNIYKKEIAKEFDCGTVLFSNWLSCIVYLRNMAAHYQRLYDFIITKNPKEDKKDSIKINRTYKVFDILYVMRKFFIDKNKWNNFILTSIQQLFDQYKESIDISAYGFDEDWFLNLKLT